MCSVSSPKPDPNAVAAANKKPQYMRNPWLDGLSLQGNAENGGRNSLVIDPGTTGPTTNTNTVLPPTFNPLGLRGAVGGMGPRDPRGIRSAFRTENL